MKPTLHCKVKTLFCRPHSWIASLEKDDTLLLYKGSQGYVVRYSYPKNTDMFLIQIELDNLTNELTYRALTSYYTTPDIFETNRAKNLLLFKINQRTNHTCDKCIHRFQHQLTKNCQEYFENERIK